MLRTLSDAFSSLADIHHILQKQALITVAPSAHGRLLDVGCGNKPWRSLFAPYVNLYQGVEYGETYSQTAASDAANPDQPDFFYDGRRLPFDDASYDTVVSFQVLEHTPTPQALVTEMARLLRPGGTLILSAPFSYREHEAPNDFFRFTSFGLSSLCTSAGLQVQQVVPFGGLWSVLAHKLNGHLVLEVGRLQGLGQQLGKFSQESMTRTSPRWWSLPLVVPSLVVSTTLARLGDRLRPDEVERLGYVIVATRPG